MSHVLERVLEIELECVWAGRPDDHDSQTASSSNPAVNIRATADKAIHVGRGPSPRIADADSVGQSGNAGSESGFEEVRGSADEEDLACLLLGSETRPVTGVRIEAMGRGLPGN